jgi:Ca2+-binding EF-hand superfamily protein
MNCCNLLELTIKVIKILDQNNDTTSLIEVLKFIKILNFNVKEDGIVCIVETMSISLEYVSFQRLKTVYEEFLKCFATTIEED